jgi:uncharacterized protein (DUF2267 family)
MAELGPDRQRAYHTLRAVLHALRDRLPLNLAAHLGAQLPLLVRGICYDSWHPQPETTRERKQEKSLDHVAAGLRGTRPVNGTQATRIVFRHERASRDRGAGRRGQGLAAEGYRGPVAPDSGERAGSLR